MRRFSSYGPINTKLHYYVPRQSLVDQAVTHLVGEVPSEGGHYITVWAPRQTGKTWVLQEVLHRLEREQSDFYVAKLNLHKFKRVFSAPILRSRTAALRDAMPVIA